MNFQDHAHFRVLPASPCNLSNTKISGSRSRGSAGGADVTVHIPLGHYELYDQHQFQALTGGARAQLLSRKRLFFFSRLSPFYTLRGISMKQTALKDFRTHLVLNFSFAVRNSQRYGSACEYGGLRTNISTFTQVRYNINVPHSLIK